MAGGIGERLWPLSRINYPKQFLNLIGNQSLLQSTFSRFLRRYSSDDIYILTNPSLYHLVKLQLDELNPSLARQILLEPEKKNTGPAIALAMKFFEDQHANENEIFLFCPADSYISPEENFLRLIDRAKTLALKGQIVIFGVSPYKPETGYGYIKIQGEEQVEKFIEKPNLADAKRFVQEGNYLWNCGIFLFSMKSFFEELKFHAPDIFNLIEGSYNQASRNFDRMPEISIDYAVIEKSNKVSVIQMDLIWGDVGNWDSLYDLSEKDESGNVRKGEITCFDSKNNLIFSQSRHIVTSCIDQLVIIDTKDILFVGKQNHSQEIKEIVSQLKESDRSGLLENTRTYRPWGFFETLSHGEGYKVKKIHVFPFEKLSLQYHHHRKEHWIIIRGQALITKGVKEAILEQGESVFIEKNEIHRIENPSNIPLEIIETQLGEKLEEEDIVRLEDQYGRAEEITMNIPRPS